MSTETLAGFILGVSQGKGFKLGGMSVTEALERSMLVGSLRDYDMSVVEYAKRGHDVDLLDEQQAANVAEVITHLISKA